MVFILFASTDSSRAATTREAKLSLFAGDCKAESRTLWPLEAARRLTGLRRQSSTINAIESQLIAGARKREADATIAAARSNNLVNKPGGYGDEGIRLL
jgi:hypothetical protein